MGIQVQPNCCGGGIFYIGLPTLKLGPIGNPTEIDWEVPFPSEMYFLAGAYFTRWFNTDVDGRFYWGDSSGGVSSVCHIRSADDADGGNETLLYTAALADRLAGLTANYGKICFCLSRPDRFVTSPTYLNSTAQFWIMNADGSGLTMLDSSIGSFYGTPYQGLYSPVFDRVVYFKRVGYPISGTNPSGRLQDWELRTIPAAGGSSSLVRIWSKTDIENFFWEAHGLAGNDQLLFASWRSPLVYTGVENYSGIGVFDLTTGAFTDLKRSLDIAPYQFLDGGRPATFFAARWSPVRQRLFYNMSYGRSNTDGAGQVHQIRSMKMNGSDDRLEADQSEMPASNASGTSSPLITACDIDSGLL